MKRTAKLKLHRETLRLLDPSDLEQAHGQTLTAYTNIGCRTYTCNISCGGTCEPGACFPTTTFYC
jgi:hypothetical protein